MPNAQSALKALVLPRLAQAAQPHHARNSTARSSTFHRRIYRIENSPNVIYEIIFDWDDQLNSICQDEVEFQRPFFWRR